MSVFTGSFNNSDINLLLPPEVDVQEVLLNGNKVDFEINVIEESIGRIVSPDEIHVTSAVYIVLAITILVKILLTRLFSSEKEKGLTR